MYESGIADTLNRTEAAIGSGVEGADEAVLAEASAVTKQTSDTLMAGERIMEAIEIADRERGTWRAYEDERAEASEEEKARMPPPARHPVLAALDQSPEEYVLKVVEKVRSAELFDALLVLPFGKVVSLLEYLNEWALRVCVAPLDSLLALTIRCVRSGISSLSLGSCSFSSRPIIIKS